MARILVVEDSKPIALMIEKILTREQHEVEVVYDGERAFQRLCAQEYDLVTMDINLPGLGGDEAIMAIEVERPRQRILVVSATKDKALRRAMLEDFPTVVGWLEKPFDYTSLTLAVREALEQTIAAEDQP